MANTYPDGIDERWRLPPTAFTSSYQVGRFRDAAPLLDVDALGLAGGSIMDDFDADGDLDIMASSMGLRDQLRIFRHNSDGSFTDETMAAGLGGLLGGLNLVPADYNNDGFLDVLVLRGAWRSRGHPNSLLRNNGDGTFDDVTEQAGLFRPVLPTQTAGWADYDNDGWIDLYVGNESDRDAPHPGQLFHNNGNGTFTDVASETGTAVVGFTKGITWGDINNDGWADLYVSRLGQPNVLLRNQGPDSSGQWKFADVTQTAGVSEPLYSLPTWFWDYDNDGWVDLFVSGYRASLAEATAEYLGLPHEAETPRLYRNKGDGTFSDVTSVARLNKVLYSMGSNYGDLDGDGYLDFYVGTGEPNLRTMIPSRMFRNANGGFFQEVTTSGGFGHFAKGHGVAFGDIDADGDQDIYMVLGGSFEGDAARNVLLENPGNRSPWITLQAEGVQANRGAVGARIAVTVETPAGRRVIYRTVSTGGSFGASSLQQEIGLGDATEIVSIEVTWPSASQPDIYTSLTMNRVYRIREGVVPAIPVKSSRLPLPR